MTIEKFFPHKSTEKGSSEEELALRVLSITVSVHLFFWWRMKLVFFVCREISVTCCWREGLLFIPAAQLGYT